MSGVDLVAVLFIAWLFGFITGAYADRGARREERKRRELEASNPQPICGCGHHLAFHSEKDSECHHEGWDPDANRGRGCAVPCLCQRYVGPEPITQFLVP